MENNVRFMAKELPENEMKMLNCLLGKEPGNNENLKQRSRFWSWWNINF